MDSNIDSECIAVAGGRCGGMCARGRRAAEDQPKNIHAFLSPSARIKFEISATACCALGVKRL